MHRLHFALTYVPVHCVARERTVVCIEITRSDKRGGREYEVTVTSEPHHRRSHRNECWARGRTKDASHRPRSGKGPDGGAAGRGASPYGPSPAGPDASKDPDPFHHHHDVYGIAISARDLGSKGRRKIRSLKLKPSYGVQRQSGCSRSCSACRACQTPWAQLCWL